MSTGPRISPSPTPTNGTKAVHEPGTTGTGDVPRRRGNGLAYALAGVATAVVGVFAVFAVVLWADANHTSKASEKAAATAPQASADHSMASMPGMDMSGASTSPSALTSFAGAAPADPEAAAAAHKPYPAAMPPIPAGPVANVNLVLSDVTVQIAPGVKYAAWAWANGAPGPVIHVRQGQKVKITLTNDGAIPHSVDFHAARIAPDKAFGDVMPGDSVSYTFTAGDPGVYMYHCGTKPVLMHIANGMYGAIVVEPKPGVLPKADRDYVLVASEWYLSTDGLRSPAQFNMDKAHARMPDWMTFNGYAGLLKVGNVKGTMSH
jgi:FtsP/CotA-like multicopper oxidase with cupredoxin domain